MNLVSLPNSYLRTIGDDTFPIDVLPDTIQLPDNIGTFVHTEEDLIEAIYPELLTHYSDMSWLSKQLHHSTK